MLKILPVITIAACCFTSCVQYHYLTLESGDLQKNEKKEFVLENDSVRLVYNFNGDQGPVNLSITNKSTIPLHIDWEQSRMIINDTSEIMDQQVIPFNAKIEDDRSRVTPGSERTYEVAGTSVKQPEAFAFIPPGTTYSHTARYIASGKNLYEIPDSAFKAVKGSLFNGYTGKAKEATFDASDTPLSLQVYLTVIWGDRTNGLREAYSHHFYVSSAMKAIRLDQYENVKLNEIGKQFMVLPVHIK